MGRITSIILIILKGKCYRRYSILQKQVLMLKAIALISVL